MKKIYLFLLYLFVVINHSNSQIHQNVLYIDTISSGPNQIVTFNVYVVNSQNFVAFQLDIILPGVLTYVNNSATLTSRSNNHQLAVNLIGQQTLRLLAFSTTGLKFFGNTGSILRFQCKAKTEPGVYDLQIQNPILTDSSLQNIITNYYNGRIILLAPNIKTNLDSLDFGSIPLRTYADRNLIIYNLGTSVLNISRFTSTNVDFYFLDSSSVVLNPNSSIQKVVRFYPAKKGYKSGNFIIKSNDPDDSIKIIHYKAHSYAVNELRTLPVTGRTGFNAEMNFTINNMEPFVGFQFDIRLPPILRYIKDSIWLSSRKQDHIVQANYIGEDVLRVIAFSPSNKPFLDTLGPIVKILFRLDGTGGYYYPQLQNVIITDSTGTNILSAYYNSYIHIASPDIHGTNSFDFGEISVLDTVIRAIDIWNYGNDTLKITAINSNNPVFKNLTQLPIIILPYQKKEIQISYHSLIKGINSGRLIIRSNDPDEDPFYINLRANSFHPNYLKIYPYNVYSGDTVKIDIYMSNYDTVVAFQFDLSFPDSLKYIPNSAELSYRKQDHILFVNNLSSNKLRLLAFSLTKKPFLFNDGIVLHLKFVAGEVDGNFSLILSNALLANSLNENVLRDVINGSIQINRYRKQELWLNQGWSLISTNLALKDSTLDSIFHSIRSQLLLLKNNNGQVYWPELGINTIGKWNIKEGYRAYFKQSAILRFEGKNIDPSQFPIALPNGWNMISYLRNSPLGIDTCLQSIASNFILVKNNYGQVYWPEYGINTIGAMIPGQGYQIYMKTPDTLIYPNNSLQLMKNVDYSSFNNTTIKSTGSSAVLLVQCSDCSNEDQIEVLNSSNELVGFGRFEDGNCLITVWGDDITTQEVDGAIEGEKLTLKYKSSRSNYKYSLEEFSIRNALTEENSSGVLIYKENSALVVTLNNRKNELNDFLLNQNYPNPFNSKTTISFIVPKTKQIVSLKLFDMLGNELAALINSEVEPGYHSIEFDASNLSSGLYFYSLKIGKKIVTKKMLLLK